MSVGHHTRTVPCKTCGAKVGEHCVDARTEKDLTPRRNSHPLRVVAAQALAKKLAAKRAEKQARASERIMVAAIWDTSSGAIYSVPRPGRHHTIFSVMKLLRLEHPSVSPHLEVAPVHAPGNSDDLKQGFLTSLGRFVGRFEAKKIAVRAQQLLSRAMHGPQLFSKDVW